MDPSSSPTPPPKIHKLPPELWAIILEHNTSKQDLRNLTVTSKRLRSFTAPFLFRSFLLRVSTESFAKLQRICEHPILSTYVRRLQYDGRIIAPRLANQAEWDRYLMMNGLYECFTQLTLAQRREHYDEILNHIEEQKQLLTQEKTSILRFLQSLPELCELHIKPEDQSAETSFDHKLLLWTVSKCLHFWYQRENTRYLWDILAAATSSNAKIRTLRLTGLSLSRWNERKRLPKFSCLLDVTSLTLSLLPVNFGRKAIIHEDKRKDDDNSDQDRLSTQLDFVEKLDISFQWLAHEFRPAYVTITDVIETKEHWERLQHLSLSSFRTCIDHLKAVFAKLSRTLRLLKLGGIEFVNSDGRLAAKGASWLGFFQYLHNNLSLQDVTLSGRFSNGYDESWLAELLPGDGTPFEYSNPCTHEFRTINDATQNLKKELELYIAHKGPFPFVLKASLSETSSIRVPEDQMYIDARASGSASAYVDYGLPWIWIPDTSWEFFKQDLPRNAFPDIP